MHPQDEGAQDQNPESHHLGRHSWPEREHLWGFLPAQPLLATWEDDPPISCAGQPEGFARPFPALPTASPCPWRGRAQGPLDLKQAEPGGLSPSLPRADEQLMPLECGVQAARGLSPKHYVTSLSRVKSGGTSSLLGPQHTPISSLGVHPCPLEGRNGGL